MSLALHRLPIQDFRMSKSSHVGQTGRTVTFLARCIANPLQGRAFQLPVIPRYAFVRPRRDAARCRAGEMQCLKPSLSPRPPPYWMMVP
jgi:hypothetical protein